MQIQCQSEHVASTETYHAEKRLKIHLPCICIAGDQASFFVLLSRDKMAKKYRM